MQQKRPKQTLAHMASTSAADSPSGNVQQSCGPNKLSQAQHDLLSYEMLLRN